MTRSALPLLALALLSACSDEPEPLGLVSATIVANPVPGRPSAGYLTLRGGPTDQVLEYARVPYARRTEMHESVAADGRTAMRPVERVPIPAGRTVEFKPGGLHLMIFDLDPAALRDGRTPIQLRFSDGSQIEYRAVVQRMGQATR